MSSAPRLILASGSPRRRELLLGLGISFTVRPADVDETPRPAEDPAEYVVRLAAEKAEAEAHGGELVLAADTTVVLEGEILGKPADPEDACRMLAKIAGREHEVLSGVALWEPARQARAVALERTRVKMAPLTPEEIRWYVGTGEPMDKAGSYAVQGLGSMLVLAVFGSYTNVVGLPVPLTRRLFGELGHDLLDFRAAAPPIPRT